MEAEVNSEMAYCDCYLFTPKGGFARKLWPNNVITIENCDQTFLKIFLRFKKKSNDVSTLAKRHYQGKIC